MYSARCFLELLSDISEIFNIEVHGYCLMDNHYHLLLRTPNANLARAMRHLNGTYTLRFNRLESTDGSLFRGRYKSILMGDDKYLLNMSRYIHLNPTEAILVEKAEDYRWSSCSQFLGKSDKKNFLITEHIFSQLNKEEAVREYKMFLEQGSEQDLKDFYNQKQIPAILGSDEFIEKMIAGLGDDKLNKSLPDINRMYKPPTLAEIMTITAQTLNVALDTLKLSIPGQNNWPRMLSIYISRRYFGYKMNEICEAFTNISTGSIYTPMQRAEEFISNDINRQSEHDDILETLND